MVTEFVPNGDLFKFLQVEKDIDWKFKLKMALDIAKGMQYLHSISPPLIHRFLFLLSELINANYCILFRDLKSPNVLMESFDPKAEVNCKVADFGLTR
jgi:serine/threonine protein kinase